MRHKDRGNFDYCSYSSYNEWVKKKGKTRSSKKAVSRSVGIRELKNRASELVEQVERTRRPIWITKHHRRIAQIIPSGNEDTDPRTLLRELGLISRPALEPWSTLELLGKPIDATAAIQAILKDREEGF